MSKEEVMAERLHNAFDIQSLDIINESAKHKGHLGDDGSGESHFRIIVVSRDFEAQSRIAQQRSVFQALGDDIVRSTHSISLKIESS